MDRIDESKERNTLFEDIYVLFSFSSVLEREFKDQKSCDLMNKISTVEKKCHSLFFFYD